MDARPYTLEQILQAEKEWEERYHSMLPRLPYKCIKWTDCGDGYTGGIQTSDTVYTHQEMKRVVEVLAKFYGLVEGDK